MSGPSRDVTPPGRPARAALANGTPTGVGGRQRYEPANLGRAVPGAIRGFHHRGAVLQGASTYLQRIPVTCCLRRDAAGGSGTFSAANGASCVMICSFSSPLAVTAGDDLTWRRTSPSTGHRGGDHRGACVRPATNAPLNRVACGGVYAYGSSNTFPTSTWNNNTTGGRGAIPRRRRGHGAGGVDCVAASGVEPATRLWLTPPGLRTFSMACRGHVFVT